jgi:hypothetical protein
MKPMKLKCVLYTDDGQIWICIRQFYVTDVSTQDFREESFAGMKLKRIDKTEENNEYCDNEGQI